MSTTISGPVTLIDRVVPRSAAGDVIVVAVGATLIGLLAQVAVPLWPVPITGQTLAVILVAASTGLLRGLSSIGIYVALGAVGVPWFSDGSAGWQVLVGPTAGYIAGFILAAAIVGWASDHGVRRFSWKMFALYTGASAVVFIPGVAWLAVSLNLNLEQALMAGLYPFVLGGVIKAAIATALLPAMWFGADRLSSREK